MRPITPATVRATRWLLMLLLGSTLILSPLPGSAEHDNTCHPSGGSGGNENGLLGIALDPNFFMLALKFRIADDHPPVHGIIHFGDAIFTPERDSAQATCASRGGTETTGLLSLTVDLRNVRTGDIVRVTLASDRPIDASGIYTIVIRGLADEPIELQVRVLLSSSASETEER